MSRVPAVRGASRIAFVGMETDVAVPTVERSEFKPVARWIGREDEPWGADLMLGPGGFWSFVRDPAGRPVGARDAGRYLSGVPGKVDKALDHAFAGTPVGAWAPGGMGVPPVSCLRGERAGAPGSREVVQVGREDASRALARFVSREVAYCEGRLAVRRRPLMLRDSDVPLPYYMDRAPWSRVAFPLRPDALDAFLDIANLGPDERDAYPKQWRELAACWPDEPDDARALLNGYAGELLARIDRIAARMPDRDGVAGAREGFRRVAARSTLGLAGEDDLASDLDLFRRGLDLAIEYGGRHRGRDAMPTLRRLLLEVVIPRALPMDREDAASLGCLGR